MRHTITFSSETQKFFPANHKASGSYKATIQNLTNQSITVTVTNKQPTTTAGDYDTPAAGALVIAAGAVGALTEPYSGWLLTAGVAATGTVEIVEAG